MQLVMKYVLMFIASSFLFVDDYQQVKLQVYKEKLTKKDKFQEETILTFRVPEDSIEIIYNDSVIKKMKLTRMDDDEAWYSEWSKEYYRILNDEFTCNDTIEIRFLTLKKKFFIPIDKKYRNIDLYYVVPRHEYTINNAILNYKNSRWIVE